MAKTLGMIFGVVFILVGLLGFVPNPIIGEAGIFETDLVHNLVHLVIGIVLVVGARKGESMAVVTMKVVAVVYLLVAALGFIMGEGKLLGLVHVNAADNWLHLVLAVVLWVAAMVAGKKGSMGSGVMGGQM